MEKEIEMEQEPIIVQKGGGGDVKSVNGKTGDVVLTTSDLENTSDYQTGTEVGSAISTAIGNLATVATTGDYDDLVDKPTIGDATLTVQKNSTQVGTFSANATTNQTINITVPVTAADVSALPASTKYAASLTMSIDSTTYVVTTTLKDQDGNTLGTAQTIDLPLESVVVNGSYDSVNKKIVLTLQSGTTIDIPVADLVSGLQTEITSSNKLASDLVDDSNQTNLFVTSGEKSTWSGKQDTLTAGANISISAQNEISATDTTYSNFVGTDGVTAGTAGLVPAPATTDAGKFLKADGTWDTAGGSSVNVVQTIGTSASDVMSQNATSGMVFADPGVGEKIRIGNTSNVGSGGIGIGQGVFVSGSNHIAVGSYTKAVGNATAIGYGAEATAANGTALGYGAKASGANSIGFAFSNATVQGQVQLTLIGGQASNGYNNTKYRIISGVYDGQDAHDAATVGQINALIDAINTATGSSIPHIGS